MFFNSLFFNLLSEQQFLKTVKTKPLVDAIVNRHPITFYYTGPQTPKKDSVKTGTRVNGEPVAMGLSKKGNLIVRVYVPSPNVSKKGFSKTNWRTFMVSRMSNVQIDDNKTFDGKRPQYKEGDDSSMTVTYVTSNWGISPKVEPEKKPTVKPKPTAKVPEKPKELPKPEVKPVPPKELPEPEVKDKPSPLPEKPTVDQSIDVYNKLKSFIKDIDGQKVVDRIEYQKSLDDLYKRKEKEWVEKQKQIPNGNIKPGEGTRSRFLKSADRELTTLLHKDNISISDNQLQESLNKIKSLMLL